MSLVIDTEERDLETPPEPEPARIEVKPVVKVIKPSMFAPVKKEEKSPSKKVSPKKESPKETIKPIASKGIASFFSAKPVINGSKKTEETKKEKISPEVKTEKKSPKEIEKKIIPEPVEKKKTPESKEEKKKPVFSDKKSKTNKKTENLNSLKRTLDEINGSDESDDDETPGTPQEKKVVQNRKKSRPAKTNKIESKNTKRIVAVDSSSDEDVKVTVADDDDDDVVIEIKEEPEKDVNKNVSKKNENGSKKKRCIRKRMVQKTYEDDEGYLSEFLFNINF